MLHSIPASLATIGKGVAAMGRSHAMVKVIVMQPVDLDQRKEEDSRRMSELRHSDSFHTAEACSAEDTEAGASEEVAETSSEASPTSPEEGRQAVDFLLALQLSVEEETYLENTEMHGGLSPADEHLGADGAGPSGPTQGSNAPSPSPLPSVEAPQPAISARSSQHISPPASPQAHPSAGTIGPSTRQRGSILGSRKAREPATPLEPPALGDSDWEDAGPSAAVGGDSFGARGSGPSDPALGGQNEMLDPERVPSPAATATPEHSASTDVGSDYEPGKEVNSSRRSSKVSKAPQGKPPRRGKADRRSAGRDQKQRIEKQLETRFGKAYWSVEPGTRRRNSKNQGPP